MPKIRLGDLAVLITSGSRGWAPYYAEDGAAFLRMGNVRRESIRLRLDQVQHVKLPPSISEGTRTEVRPGDILISITAELGKVGYVYEQNLGEAYVNQHLCLLRLDRNKVWPEFVALLLSSPPCWRRFQELNDSGAKAGLNLPAIRSFEIELPSLETQRRVAKILRTWDDAIEKTDRLVAAKDVRLNWIRQNLISGRVRLPGFDKPWKLNKLAHVLSEHGQRSTGIEPVFSVSVHRGLVDQVEHLGRSFAAASTDHYNRVLPGDIVYTKSPTGDFPWGIVKQSTVEQPVIVSPLYGVFSPATFALGTILDLHFASPIATTNYLAPLVQKGAKNTINITNARFLEGKVLLPSDAEEQEAIAGVIQCARKELLLLRKQRDVVVRQKRGLMQKLLTGEWPVNVLDSQEAAE